MLANTDATGRRQQLKPDPQRSKEVTELLAGWSKGDLQAREALMPLVYNELRQLAASYLRRERSDHTLQATALVHEAYLRLVEQDSVSWQNRTIFLAPQPTSCGASWWTTPAAMPPKSAAAELQESRLPKPSLCHNSSRRNFWRWTRASRVWPRLTRSRAGLWSFASLLA